MYAYLSLRRGFSSPRGGKDGYIINSKYSLIEVLSLFQDLTRSQSLADGAEERNELSALNASSSAVCWRVRNFACFFAVVFVTILTQQLEDDLKKRG